jgi:hypothetical protein
MKELIISKILQISGTFNIGVKSKDLENLSENQLRENFKFINEYRKWRKNERAN